MESTIELEITDFSTNGFAEDELIAATNVLADITQCQKPDLIMQNISEPTNSDLHENSSENTNGKEIEVKDEKNFISEEQTAQPKIGSDEFFEMLAPGSRKNSKAQEEERKELLTQKSTIEKLKLIDNKPRRHSSGTVKMDTKLFLSNMFKKKPKTKDDNMPMTPKTPKTPKGFSLLSEGYNPKYFGATLEAIIKRDKTDLPQIVVNIIQRLEKDIDVEGIFRHSGNNSRIIELRRLFEDDQEIDLEQENTHTLCGVLKSFFRELAEPLLSYYLYDRFLMAADIQNYEIQMGYIRSLIAHLPVSYQNLLDYLIQFLLRIVSKQNENRMNTQNISIVFAPNLLKSPPKNEDTISSTLYAHKIISEEELTELRNTTRVQGILDIILNNYEEIFKKEINSKKFWVAYAKGVQAYNKKNSHEISIRKDEIITVFSMEVINKPGFWAGECEGEIGIFPAEFVTILREGAEAILTKYSEKRTHKVERGAILRKTLAKTPLSRFDVLDIDRPVSKTRFTVIPKQRFNLTQVEQCMDDENFTQLFGMTQKEYWQLPTWWRTMQKQGLGLI